ncbi:MAG: cell shape determination protein CcmA [Bacteroidetes bacterium]|nr:MAG: cell shape determination protein CcmA [Bacteroidota bacterium]
MYKPYKFLSFLFVGLLSVMVFFSSCNKDDDDTPTDEIQLLSFGPSPALRGGTLQIIGTNLDKVSAVVLPDNIEVASFDSKTSEKIELTIPEETVEGHIVLKTPDGDITSLTILTISEPIVLASFSPEVVKPGDMLTISGDYLNLINTVIFSSDVAIGDTAFVTHTRETIEVAVPENAQTGTIAVSNGEPVPIVVESETELEVALPVISDMAPNPVKAGAMLTITGTDLDLVRVMKFAGTSAVTSFESQSETTIEVLVPADAHDGNLVLGVASLVEVSSENELLMVVPQISGIAPNPVKNGEDLTITGTDLDLVTAVSFGGGSNGSISSASETELVVNVPLEAVEGTVTLHTAADKSVSSADVLTLVVPTITGFSPEEGQFGDEITISGTNLDLVTSVIFGGDVSATPNMVAGDMLTVNIPVGSATGVLSVVTGNGTVVTSETEFALGLSTNAVINNMPTLASIGQMISIEGESLDELNEVIFPGEVPATMFGQKTATLIEVFVPEGTSTGVGNIKFITFTGEEFFSPEINIQGVDPVVDPGLVFFNFDGLDSWWGDTGGIENDPELSLDGSNYFRANGSLSGWTGFFWRNGGDNFPGGTIGTNIDGYVLKFDVNVIDPITGGVIQWRLKGSDGDYWHRWNPWEASGSYSTDGWVTITIPLNQFVDNFGWGSEVVPDLSNIDSDFGAAFNDGDSFVNICIDNVRFEAL